MIKRVVMVGAGNLATQLALALYEKGIVISQVYSRTQKSAEELAWKVEASYTTNTREIEYKSDLAIYAVSDDALQEIMDHSSVPIGRCVHTAGSIPMDILNCYAIINYGVFYPLQTFSAQRKADFSNVPICVEAYKESDEGFLEDLIELGYLLSNDVRVVSSEERRQLHLAAVFASNFTNHMYSIAQKLLEEKGLDFGLLKPLIQETAHKILEMDPVSAQTGPAVRFDQKIMNYHLNSMIDLPDYQNIYNCMSENIFKMHKK